MRRQARPFILIYVLPEISSNLCGFSSYIFFVFGVGLDIRASAARTSQRYICSGVVTATSPLQMPCVYGMLLNYVSSSGSRSSGSVRDASAGHHTEQVLLYIIIGLTEKQGSYHDPGFATQNKATSRSGTRVKLRARSIAVHPCSNNGVCASYSRVVIRRMQPMKPG